MEPEEIVWHEVPGNPGGVLLSKETDVLKIVCNSGKPAEKNRIKDQFNVIICCEDSDKTEVAIVSNGYKDNVQIIGKGHDIKVHAGKNIEDPVIGIISGTIGVHTKPGKIIIIGSEVWKADDGI